MNSKEREQKAKAILEDPLILEAFATIEEATMEAWDSCPSPEQREQLWHVLKGQQKFKSVFELVLYNKELDDELGERKRGMFSV